MQSNHHVLYNKIKRRFCLKLIIWDEYKSTQVQDSQGANLLY